VLWTCPTCAAENPFEERVCTSCGTPFVELFEQPPARSQPPARRVLALSLAFPGAGHLAAGRVAEGLARAVVFAYSAGTGLVILLSRRGLGLGPFRALMAVFVLAAAVLYAITAVDGSRLARGAPQLLSTRMLLYGATGLMVLTLAVLVVSGLRAGSS
jgi:TM2 domain-containing membrane protein YozV